MNLFTLFFVLVCWTLAEFYGSRCSAACMTLLLLGLDLSWAVGRQREALPPTTELLKAERDLRPAMSKLMKEALN